RGTATSLPVVARSFPADREVFHGLRPGAARAAPPHLGRDAPSPVPPPDEGRDHPLRDLRDLDAPGLPLRGGGHPIHGAPDPEGAAGAPGAAHERDRYA